jgi:hemerythrin-like metal-binding protein
VAFLDWSDKYSLGVAEIDEQHQNLFDLVSRLHTAVSEGSDQSIYGEILNELIDYVVYHFDTEENLFKEKNYPDYEVHKQKHDDLTKQVLELQTKFTEGSATISFEVLDFLSEWLKDHTTGMDQKFTAFMLKTE